MTMDQAWEHFEVNMAMRRALAERAGWRLIWTRGEFIFERLYGLKMVLRFVIREVV